MKAVARLHSYHLMCDGTHDVQLSAWHMYELITEDVEIQKIRAPRSAWVYFWYIWKWIYKWKYECIQMCHRFVAHYVEHDERAVCLNINSPASVDSSLALALCSNCTSRALNSIEWYGWMQKFKEIDIRCKENDESFNSMIIYLRTWQRTFEQCAIRWC